MISASKEVASEIMAESCEDIGEYCHYIKGKTNKSKVNQ